MEVVATKTFIKQLKLCSSYVQESARAILESLRTAEEIGAVPDLKKMEGYKAYYRICIGNYRMGLRYVKPQVAVMTILHRGTIYTKFPPKN
jgi:mRNA interferase RelE/StbE